MKYIEVVAAIIKKDGHVLATQRGYGEFISKWEFPGGKIEANEDEVSALKREIKEELNASINVGPKLVTVTYQYDSFHLTMHCYWCNLISDFELLEHESAKWLDYQSLLTVDWLPADIEVNEAILEHWDEFDG